MPKKNRLRVCREDPYGDIEDTRPVELRKKPRISIRWKKLKEIFNLE